MKMTIGIIGCGVISNTYIKEMKRLYKDTLYIKAVAARRYENAVKTAEKYKIPCAYTVEQLLADEEIKLVVDLTPPAQHAEINMKILQAGKHLFTEKPFALEMDKALEILNCARFRGLYVGSAPDVFLTAPQQNSRLAVDSGMIGRPLYATLNMISCGVEHWHANPFFYYQYGGGPLYDMAPYYLSALINILGPIKEVYAVQARAYDKRLITAEPHVGEYIDVEVPTHYSGVLTMASGVVVSMNMSFDVYKSNLPMIEIYGTEGSISVPDPDLTNGKPKIWRKNDVLTRNGPNTHLVEAPAEYKSVARYTRGTGVAEMARAIMEGKHNRASGELAVHTLEAIIKLIRSSETGEKYTLETSVERPEAMYK